MGLVLLVLILCLLFGALPPVSGHWHGYGYGPSGVFGVIVLILIVLLLTGRL